MTGGMTVASVSEPTIEWPELLRGRKATISDSCSLDSYPSSSLSDSLACSLSSSLADLMGPPAPAAFAAEAGSSPAGATPAPELPQLPLHFLDVAAEVAPPVKAGSQLAAPVPSRVQDSQGAVRLLRTSSSHFDALEEAAVSIQLMAAASFAAASEAGSQALPGSPAGSPERSMPAGGPAPELILAALSASLAARQQQQQQQHQQRWQQRQQAEAPVQAMAAAAAAPTPAPATASGYACACCSAVFCDESAFRAHCGSLEHAMAVMQLSMAGGLPGMAAQAHAAAGLAPCHAQARGPAALPPLSHVSQTCNTSTLLAGLSGPSYHVPQPPLAAPLHPAAGVCGPSLPSHPTMPFCITSCCTQVIDPQLDLATHSLLQQLRQLDGVERAVRAHGHHLGGPRGGAKLPRRLVGGLREVRKAVRSGTAAAVVAAVDIQETNPCAAARRCCSAQPGADIAEICHLAALCGVPVVFALTRLGLGSIFGTNKRMSAVALTNVAGLEGHLERVLGMAAVGRARFAALVGQAQLC
ncbi:hypothetical protein ABPG75_008737 [Micractinium tetrahymenae]